jgi:hypothetical protein
MKGSKRRPGKSSAYEDNFDKVFVKSPKEEEADPVDLLDQQLKDIEELSDYFTGNHEKPERPVTELDKKRARFVEIHKR